MPKPQRGRRLDPGALVDAAVGIGAAAGKMKAAMTAMGTVLEELQHHCTVLVNTVAGGGEATAGEGRFDARLAALLEAASGAGR